MPQSSPPPRRRPRDLAGYLETLSRPVFQAGISWRVIEAKWDGIHDAFEGFDPKKVAAFGPKKVDRLMADESIVRSRPKIEAVIDNAQTLLELDAEHGGFARYLTVRGDTAATNWFGLWLEARQDRPTARAPVRRIACPQGVPPADAVRRISPVTLKL